MLPTNINAAEFKRIIYKNFSIIQKYLQLISHEKARPDHLL